MAQPRATCDVCGRDVALTPSEKLWPHYPRGRVVESYCLASGTLGWSRWRAPVTA